MFIAVARVCRMVLLLGLTAVLLACGNSASTPTSSSESTPAALVSISVSPATVILGAGQSASAQFTAKVSGSSNSGASWSVNGVAGGNTTVGTISSAGLYTPPAAAGPAQVTVTAASAADSTKSASASVVLVTSAVTATQNLQVAQYSFTSPVTAIVTVQFGTDTSYSLRTSSQTVPAGGTANVLVAGMRASTTYHMRVSASFAAGVQYLDADHTFTTGALPSTRLPSFTVTVPAGAQTSPGIQLLSLAQLAKTPANPIEAVAVDLQGNVIWYYDFSSIPNVAGDLPFPIKPLSNGHMKLIIGSPNPSPPVSIVREIDLAGNTISELTTADLNAKLAQIASPIVSVGFHHDFAVLPNGHTIYLIMEQRNVTLTGDTSPTLFTGDALIDLDQNENVVWTWSTFDHFDVNYHPFQVAPGCGLAGATFCDWTHSNAIVYSPDDGNLVLSSRNLSWVSKIDYHDGAGTGDVLWKLGPSGDFTLEGGGASDWFYNQHYPNLLSRPTVGTFTLGVWDNGNSRPDPISGIPCGDGGLNNGGPPCYSRALLMTINETAKTAAIVWQDNLSPLFALCCGNINVLANGNVDIGAGGDSFFPAATEALEVTQETEPKVVWQLNVSGEFSYRMIRIPSLYPERHLVTQ